MGFPENPVKAIFKKTVVEKLHEIYVRAMRENRTVDYVLLTPQEYAELRADRRYWSIFDGPRYYGYGDPAHTTAFRTITLEDKRSPLERRVLRCALQGSVMGMDVFVAPEEFH